jgi:hypothetical protein
VNVSLKRTASKDAPTKLSFTGRRAIYLVHSAKDARPALAAVPEPGSVVHAVLVLRTAGLLMVPISDAAFQGCRMRPVRILNGRYLSLGAATYRIDVTSSKVSLIALLFVLALSILSAFSSFKGVGPGATPADKADLAAYSYAMALGRMAAAYFERGDAAHARMALAEASWLHCGLELMPAACNHPPHEKEKRRNKEEGQK